jgi:hypothetical protein
MKIAEEGALTDFDRRTGRPQTERGRDLAPKKKYLGDEERSQLDKLTDQYGSYANIPKQFKAQFKEGKGIKSMITRERLEEILREEIAAVAEGGAQGHFDPVGKIVRDAMIGHKVGPVQAIPAAALQGVAKGDMLQNKQYNVKGSHGGQKYIIAWNDGNDQLFMNLGNPSTENLDKLDQYMQRAGYTARSSGAVPLEENMFSNLKTNIDKVLRPGKYEDRKGTEFTVGKFNEAHKLLNAAKSIIYEFDTRVANKINVVAGEVLKMRNQMLNEGVIQQEAPPVQNNQRARELLDGFKNMLKPEETAEPSACGTFLRQLADMADHESGTSDAGTMPEPLPNN